MTGQARLAKWSDSIPCIEKQTGPGGTPRLVNPFLLGCDPELLLVRDVAGLLTVDNVADLPGKAVGLDGSGTAVEFRPAPARSALQLVANLCACARTLRSLHGGGLMWYAAPMFDGRGHRTGIGGHVHFSVPVGLKTGCGIGNAVPDRLSPPETLRSEFDLDLTGLDYVAGLHASLYDLEQVQARIGTGYGRPSNFRQQPHGCEYRTFPTWLQSPHMAHLSLTLAKLALLDPAIAQWGSFQKNVAGPELMQEALRFYGRHDLDAALATRYLPEVLPRLLKVKGIEQDIRPHWGLSQDLPKFLSDKAPVEAAQRLARHLLGQTPITEVQNALASKARFVSPFEFHWQRIRNRAGRHIVRTPPSLLPYHARQFEGFAMGELYSRCDWIYTIEGPQKLAAAFNLPLWRVESAAETAKAWHALTASYLDVPAKRTVTMKINRFLERLKTGEVIDVCAE